MILNTIILLLLFYFVFTYVKTRLVIKNFKNQKIFLFILIFEHILFTGLAYYKTISLPNNDAFMYYYNAKNNVDLFSYFSPGSTFMVFLVYPFVKLGVSLFTLFCISSYISLRAFFLFYEDYFHSKKEGICFFGIPLIQYFLLLPSFHFWSGFLGKDSIIFFLLTFLLFQLKRKKIFNIKNFISLILIGLIRPYVLAIILIFACYSFAKSVGVSKKIKVFVISGLFILCAVFSPFIISRYLNLQTLSFKSLNDKFTAIAHYAKTGNSGIDLYDTNYLERIWLLLFRPLFVDAKGIYQFFVSCENLILFCFCLFFLWTLFTRKKESKVFFSYDLQFSVFLGLGLVMFISTYIYNLGLASRMRLMFMPFLFYSFQQIATQKLLNFDICKKK